MIDLRSDTLTRPTAAMLAAIAAAEVGDDVYAEDPTVAALESRVASLLGHEAGLFCATGSLANMLGVWLNVPPGQEVLCDVGAHIARAELGGHAANHGITMRTWVTADGVCAPEQVAALIAPDLGPFLVRTACVALENTHNFGGGTVQPLETLRAICDDARARDVRTHLDGARLWNAHVADGVALDTYGRLFDTVSVCFSKGLGAPVGSVLVSSAENIARARVQRKRLGAGWRQAGVLAAAADFALTHHLGRLADDHANARVIAETLAARVPGSVDPERVQTNIVVVDSGSRDAAEVVAAAERRGVRLSYVGRHALRMVTHLDVSVDQCA